MKKLIMIMAALALVAIAGFAAWQVYVPVHEDNVSVNAYEDLRQFVQIHTPEPTIQPDISSSLGTTPAPTLEPEPTLLPTPQVDFDSLRTVNPEIVAWLSIGGTNIDYPVAQHGDNDYYSSPLRDFVFATSWCRQADSC